MTAEFDQQLEGLVAARRTAMLLAETIADFVLSDVVITADLRAEYQAARDAVDAAAQAHVLLGTGSRS